MYTLFRDTCSGGAPNTDYTNIVVQAEQERAEKIFEEVTGRKFDEEDCECCGANYTVYEEMYMSQLPFTSGKTLLIREIDVPKQTSISYEKDCNPYIVAKDRYGGTYSHCKWFAFSPEEWSEPYIPEEPFDGDGTAQEFWADTKMVFGKGETPEEALLHLKKLLAL